MNFATLKFQLCGKCPGESTGYRPPRTVFYLTNEVKTRCNNCGDLQTFGKEAEMPNEECPETFVNHFMHCGVQWTDEWSCMCNDECPQCHAEIEPYKSEDADGDILYHVNEHWTPEGGWPEGCSSRED